MHENGVAIQDIRAVLPRNGTWMQRPLSAIKQITVHYDAVDAPDQYDAVGRLTSEAYYHIEKDWGGGSRGDGIMYSVSVARDGLAYWMRDLEDVTWHCGAPNYSSLAIKCDGGANQAPTDQQRASCDAIIRVLVDHMVEIPASAPDVWGHWEMQRFGGLSTACPGKFIVIPIGWRKAASAPAPVSSIQEPLNHAVIPVTVHTADSGTKTVRVRSDWDGLRVRVLPNRGSTAIGQLYANNAVTVYSQTITGNGEDWYKISEGSRKGDFIVAEGVQ